MLTRLICQDLLAAGDALSGIGIDGDGIVWLAECGSVPRQSVTDLIARGQGTGLPVLAATTSAQVAVDLADLVNVMVAHRTDDAPAARRLSAVAAAAAPAARRGRWILDGHRTGAGRRTWARTRIRARIPAQAPPRPRWTCPCCGMANSSWRPRTREG